MPVAARCDIQRGEKARCLGPLPNRSSGVVGVKSSTSHCRSKRINALEQGLAALETCGHNVLIEHLLEHVMHGHLVLLAAFFGGVSAAGSRHYDSNHRIRVSLLR